MAVLNPKGLTAAVIATTAAETVPHGTAIKNVVFSVILFSIVITSVLVPLIEKKKKRQQVLFEAVRAEKRR